MNKKKAFPDIVPKDRPVVDFKGIKDPHWLAGFADGESCFFVEKCVSKTHRSGYQVRLKFIISQDLRDVALLNSLKNYLNCGDVITDSRGLSQFIALRPLVFPAVNQRENDRKKNLTLP